MVLGADVIKPVVLGADVIKSVGSGADVMSGSWVLTL